MAALSWLRCVGVFILVALTVVAQPAPSWQTATTLSDVDFTGLSAAQKQSALKMLREMGCTCGCDMKLAQCRVEDPACAYSKGLSAMIVKGFKDGKSPDEVKKILADSALGKPRAPQKILDDPIQIPTAGAPSTGPANARIVLIEFSDFECPYCAKAADEIHGILKAYPNDVRLVYKQFPLPMHPHAGVSALASLAALEQGKFWEMHDKMFVNYRNLTRDRLITWAEQLGMDKDKFAAALESQRNKATVLKDVHDGEAAGVNGTPSIFVNGKHFNGAIQLSALKPYLDEELKSR